MYPVYNRQGVDIPLNTELSDIDKSFAIVHYAPLQSNSETSEWDIPHALDVLGVQGNHRSQILNSGDPKEIRRLYIQWSSSRTRVCTSAGPSLQVATQRHANRRWYCIC